MESTHPQINGSVHQASADNQRSNRFAPQCEHETRKVKVTLKEKRL